MTVTYEAMYKLRSPFGLIHQTAVFAAGSVIELERHARKENTVEATAPRFENCIKVSISAAGNDFRFDPTNTKDVRVRQVFTNYRCGFFQAPPHDLGINRDVNFWLVANPESRCMVIAEIDHLTPAPEIPDKKLWYSHIVNDGYAAFVFDGRSWQNWICPHDVQVYSGSITDGLKIAITGLNGRELVRASSRGHRHELITFEHMLDYCVGQRSLADILALVEMEERLRLYKEREMIYKKLLVLVRKFKGAVRSKTAAEIEDLLMELVGEKLPF